MSFGMINVKCRKCEQRLQIVFAPAAPLCEVVEKLKHICDNECPTCGEEPYENWMIESVTLPSEVNEA